MREVGSGEGSECRAQADVLFLYPQGTYQASPGSNPSSLRFRTRSPQYQPPPFRPTRRPSLLVPTPDVGGAVTLSTPGRLTDDRTVPPGVPCRSGPLGLRLELSAADTRCRNTSRIPYGELRPRPPAGGPPHVVSTPSATGQSLINRFRPPTRCLVLPRGVSGCE